MTPGDGTIIDIVSMDMEDDRTYQACDPSPQGDMTGEILKTSNSERKHTHISDKVLNIIENENIIGGKLDSEFTDRSAFGFKHSFNLHKSQTAEQKIKEVNVASFRMPGYTGDTKES